MSYGHLGLYIALRKLGADEATANAAVADLPMPQHLATTGDMQKAIGSLKTDLAVLKFAYGPITIGLLLKLVLFP